MPPKETEINVKNETNQQTKEYYTMYSGESNPVVKIKMTLGTSKELSASDSFLRSDT